MKKALIILIVLTLLFTAFGVTLVKKKDFYRQMRERFATLGKEMALRVTVTDDGESLKSTYTVEHSDTQVNVAYSFEEYAQFEWQNGAYVVPENRLCEQTGSFVLKNGELTALQGKEPPLDVQLITLSTFDFREECFDNAVIKQKSFEADVVDPMQLFGLLTVCSDMRISLTFDEVHVTQMVLTYNVASGESVTMNFTFTY